MTIKEAELTKNITDNKLLLMNSLNEVNQSQKDLMKKMSKEKYDDIHSILRSKQYADGIIELEIKKQLLIDLISEIK